MIKLPAYFVGFNSKVDGSYSLRFTTQELQSDEVSNFHNLRNAIGWLVFAENKKEIEIPNKEVLDTSKTPSQRLRACIYLYWEQCGKVGDFEVFYRDMMNNYITHTKSKFLTKGYENQYENI